MVVQGEYNADRRERRGSGAKGLRGVRERRVKERKKRINAEVTERRRGNGELGGGAKRGSRIEGIYHRGHRGRSAEVTEKEGDKDNAEAQRYAEVRRETEKRRKEKRDPSAAAC
jgi:hypothetical protein